MSSKMVPKYACLFVGYVEEQIVSQCDDFLPQLHKRFIDDVIEAPVVAVWNLTITSTSYPTFIPLFNLRTPFLTLSFLDTTLRSNDHISNSIHYKETDTHTYLHHNHHSMLGISCRRCPAIYIDETGRTLRQCFGEHLPSIDKNLPGFSIPSLSILTQLLFMEFGTSLPPNSAPVIRAA